MKYTLTKPCLKCPFRKDSLKGWLGRHRAIGISDGITRMQGTFACHETVEYVDCEDDTDDGTRKTKDTQHCARALMMLEKLEQPNQMMRISERLGLYDRRKLDMNANVFDTPKQFISHHSK